ncbi:MAG: hypothetical protein HY906_26590, partial [Deltaproteobacteria bacterium]|nr:hypothetical protein [Deltaproteobacteria bacterium]
MGKTDRGRLDATRAESLAADILAGRARADARRLLELIHAVNPTGRELPETERERRYRVKARLQSVLLHDFGDEVQARSDPAAPGTVTLWHRYAGLDACHAVVLELDEDARCRVQWQLDVGDSTDGAAEMAPAAGSTAALPAAGRATSAANLVRRGREALAAYDFEEAREQLDAAVRLSRGAPEAVVPLLELLVDHLAAYRDALAVEGALPSETMARPRVRALLALAAACCSERKTAVRLLKGMEAPAAAEVLAILAQDACRAGQLDEAQRHVAELRERDSAHPELVRLAADVARLRAAARQPLEDELMRTLERGELETGERQARALLTRWPDSELAGRTLAQLDARRRREAAAARLAEAEQALVAGDLGCAASLVHEARTLGGKPDDLEARLAAAQAAAARDARRAQEEAIVGRLTSDTSLEPDSLLGYLALDDDQRAAVRGRVQSPPLEWLEQARAARPRERPEALVAAVVAAERAEAALKAPRGFEAALAVLAPLEGVIEPLAHARALLARAREEQRAARQTAAITALGAARDALAAGDVAAALARLPQIDARVLPRELRDERDRLESAARRRDDAQRRAARVAALASTDPLAARDEAARLVGLTEGAEQAGWLRQRDELAAAVRRAFRVRVVDSREAHERGDLLDAMCEVEGGIATTLDAATGEVWLAGVRAEWVFLWVLEAASGHCCRRAVLRTPEPLGDVTAQLEARSLWLIG